MFIFKKLIFKRRGNNFLHYLFYLLTFGRIFVSLLDKESSDLSVFSLNFLSFISTNYSFACIP